MEPHDAGTAGPSIGSAAFVEMLRALEAEYFAVVAERDRLMSPELARNADAVEFEAVAEAPAGPAVEAGTVQGTANRGCKTRLARDVIHMHEGSSSLIEPDSCKLGGTTEVSIEVPKALRIRSCSKQEHGAVQDTQQSIWLSNRVTGDAATPQFMLDGMWGDLFASNEVEGEAEDGAARTFRNEYLSSLNTQVARSSFSAISCKLSSDVPLRQRLRVVPLRPSSTWVTCWDMLGMFIVLYDAFTLPVMVAWDFDVAFPGAWVACVFWAIDIVVKFNTGHFAADGTLIMDRRWVSRRYATTWLGFDLAVVSADILALSNRSFSNVVAVRGARIIRLTRLLRLLKANKIAGSVEDLIADFGAESLTLVWSVFETFCAIFLVTHFLACIWYYLGAQARHSASESWLDALPREETDDTGTSYTHALYWVLGHLVAAPVDATISPTTQRERVFTVSIIWLSLLIVGVGISKMTNAIAELNRSRADAHDTKRRLRQVLRSTGVGRAVVSRVVRFALHSMRRQRDLTADKDVTELLSAKMAKELIVHQRGSLVKSHPLLAIVNDEHPEVFSRVCSSFQAHVYADDERIFSMDTISECLYCTISGLYHFRSPVSLTGSATEDLVRQSRPRSFASAEYVANTKWFDEDGFLVEAFDKTRFLCEISLFCPVLHQSELKTQTFADALTLTGADFVSCVRVSPKCIGLLSWYARGFINLLTQSPETNFECVPLHDLRLLTSNIDSTGPAASPNLDSPKPDRREVQLLIERLQDAEAEDQPDMSSGSEMIHDIGRMMSQAFTELDPQHGIFAKLEEEDHRRRTLASMFSFMWLLRDDCHRFTAAQAPNRKISLDMWAGLQSFVKWVDLNSAEIHAMLVYLVMRGLADVPSMLIALPTEDRCTEGIVQRLLHCMRTQVPCKHLLNHNQMDLLEKTNTIHRAFSFSHFLMGENTPHQVFELQELQKISGERVFKFSLLAAFADMCGARGAESSTGSLAMDADATAKVLAAVAVLRHVGQADPVAIYWTYISSQARSLALPFDEEEDLGFARLACLFRASPDTLGELKAVWSGLMRHERAMLTEHLTACNPDGVAYMLTSLPAYLANASKNPAVTLKRALVLLLDILEMLEAGAYGSKLEMPMVPVCIAELANFAKEVARPSTFMAIIEHLSVVNSGSGLRLAISAKHRHGWVDDSERHVQANVRRISRDVAAVAVGMERCVGGARMGAPPRRGVRRGGGPGGQAAVSTPALPVASTGLGSIAL